MTEGTGHEEALRDRLARLAVAQEEGAKVAEAVLSSVAFQDGKKATGEAIYLASPYSSPDPFTRWIRYFEAGRYAAYLMRHGLYVFSPIVHCHPLAETFGLPLSWDYWRGYDLAMLAACARVEVLALPGWRESRGVQEEIATAIGRGKGVTYIREDWIEEDRPGESITNMADRNTRLIDYTPRDWRGTPLAGPQED